MSGRNCDEALTNLYQYLDREMGAADSDRIRAHLDDCSGCLDVFWFEVSERLRAALAKESVGEL